MEKFRKFIQDIKQLPNELVRYFTGETFEPTEEDKKRSEKIRRDADKFLIFVEGESAYLEFRKFAVKNSVEYFNKAAEKNPEKAATLSRLAQLAATVNPNNMRGGPEHYGLNEAEIKEWHIHAVEYNDDIMRHAAGKLDTFIESNPKAWEALLRCAPERAEQIRRYKSESSVITPKAS